jgi:prolyl oligopeptidase
MEHVLLDPSAFPNASVDIEAISGNGQTIAYKRHANNADEATLYLRDVTTGVDSAIDVFPGMAYGSATFTADSKGLLYAQASTDPSIPPALRQATLTGKRHVLGTNPATDRVEHPATGDPSRFGDLRLTWSGNWEIWVETFETSSWWIKDTRVPDAPWQPLVTDAVGVSGFAEVDDRFYISLHDAPLGRVVRIDPANADPSAWQTLVPEGEFAISGSGIVGGKLVLEVGWAGLSWLEVRELDGQLLREIRGDAISTLTLSTSRPDEDTFYAREDTFFAPLQLFVGSISTGALAPYQTPRSSFDPGLYTVEQVRYASRDGTEVPMFILSRRGRSGPAPLVLYGYGGFNISLTPGFDPFALTWLDLGGSYAIANIRGGGELGEAWHDAGRLARKQNCFDDFIAAADYLVQHGYTTPSQLAIMGGSNGGLLTGAVTMQRPELFRAVVSQVPLLDMVRYPRFGLGTAWIDEYGDPTEEDAFGWLYTLSPYHHVVRGTDYPSVLLVSADHDDRVDPLHARKMAAALQAASASDNPVLLWTQHNAGHSGASSFDDYLTQSTDTLSFLAHETGLVIPERVRSATPSRHPPVPPPWTWRNADRFAPRTAVRW